VKAIKEFGMRLALVAALGLVLAACGPDTAVQPATPTAPQAPPTDTVVPLPTPDVTPTMPGANDLTPTPEPAMTPSPNATPAGGEQPAPIESVEVLVLESFPVQVNVKISGYLPTPCHKLGAISTSRPDANTFQIDVPMSLPSPDQVCIEVIEPFEQTVSLDVAGLKAGTYTVKVNDITEQFTLDVDNVAP
jgi:hypothetical protein